ncbi:hypothetical protein [Neptuniibacter sp. QD37_11]|uniref:hypothetical protein n=1 Tax=Neptuniibacter sp. QD37_11 TaxID=3398209 RepID=UPI0039F5E208
MKKLVLEVLSGDEGLVTEVPNTLVVELDPAQIDRIKLLLALVRDTGVFEISDRFPTGKWCSNLIDDIQENGDSISLCEVSTRLQLIKIQDDGAIYFSAEHPVAGFVCESLSIFIEDLDSSETHFALEHEGHVE